MNSVEVSKVDQVFRTGFWLQRTQVLHDVSLNVPEGSVFGFLGANGAGKTTLIQLIVGLREPTRGRVLISGVDASRVQARARLGYLPERPYFYPHLKGDEFLRYYGTLSGLTRAQIHARIPKVMGLVGLREARAVELGRYSKGMLQRIGIAQAILHEPELLVLDEPMSGLDPIGRREIRDLILELSKAGHTVFFSSHVIPDVEAICTQVGLIAHGKMIGCGPIGSFLSQGPLRTEVAFTHSSEKTVQGLQRPLGAQVERIPDGYRISLEGRDEVNQFVASLLAAKGAVLWVTPQRPSLESLFGGTMPARTRGDAV